MEEPRVEKSILLVSKIKSQLLEVAEMEVITLQIRPCRIYSKN